MNAAKGILTGILLGLVCWSAIGLACIYYNTPAPEVWACHTDMECELEAQRKGLPIDKD